MDAGATRITVNIERGGLESIEVVDDGAGMEADELALSLRRHATSKLRAAVELESIATLGFRGEGLASIAAVTQVEILSRPAHTELGARVTASGERIGNAEPAAAPVGTRVRAVRLFEELPVRREYLRSAGAEFNRISSWLSSFALAYPAVTFTLRHDGKEVWVMPSSANEAERLAMVFGRDGGASAASARRRGGATARRAAARFRQCPGKRPARSEDAAALRERPAVAKQPALGSLDERLCNLHDDRPPRLRRALSRFGARASRSQRPSDQERRTAALRQSSLRCGPPHHRGNALGSR